MGADQARSTGLSRRGFVQAALGAGLPLALPGCALFCRPEPSTTLARPLVDVHCHVFNAEDIPVYAFVRQTILEQRGDIAGAAKPVVFLIAAIMTGVAPGADREEAALTGPRPLAMATLEERARPVANGLARLVDPAFTFSLADGARQAPDDLPSYDERQRLYEELRRRFLGPASAPGPLRSPLDAPTRSEIDLLALRLLSPAPPSDEVPVVFEGFGLFDIPHLIDWALGFVEFRYQRVDRLAALLADEPAHPRLMLPALVDYGFWLRGHDEPATGFADQVRLMGLLARHQPEHRLMHCFLGFNPWRYVRQPAATMKLLDEAIHRHGFVGVKLYPPMGFQPWGNAALDFPGYPTAPSEFSRSIQAAMEALFRYCEDQDVPILAHSASSNMAYPKYGARANPEYWEPVLQKHPKLRVNFGHFGGAWDAAKDDAWARSIVRLMRYANVYADIADLELVLRGPEDPDLGRMKAFLGEQAPTPLPQRLLFGTDWAMLGRVPGYSEFPARMLELIASVPGYDVADFGAGNALRYLGLDDPASGTRRRLEEFHGPGSKGRIALDRVIALAEEA